MIVNHKAGFIFFHVPKTAGCSIMHALARDPDSLQILKPTKHWTPEQYFETVAPESAAAVRGYFRFCFVRDPWERFGSLHRFLLLRHRELYNVPDSLDAFAELLAERGDRLQPRHSTRPQCDFARGADFVGRYENLDRDFRRAARLIGFPWRFWKRLKRKNGSGDEVVYRRLMSARSQEIIGDFYREDIERFGYG